ncbi:MAG: diguanylate cyclase [Lachnospiraceae bacterium]
MEKKEVEFIITQIQRILSNQPLLDEFTDSTSPQFQELQESIAYLSSCLIEVNEFMYSLCNGKLEIEAPSRYNFLAGNLKELHSILKYLTWQTSQVAKGDYHQRVNFLGEFSDAFNLLVEQLEEREIGLNEKTKELSQSMDLLVSIIDAQKEGILVIDVGNQEVIYSNQKIQKHFYDAKSGQSFCKESCPLLERLKIMKITEKPIKQEYYCERVLRYFEVTSSPVNWGGHQAMVHYMSDVSLEKERTESLRSLAYKDDLTGIHNRRYCTEMLIMLTNERACFSLVVVDLDGLKYVNDIFGHLSGDEYLCTVVDIIKENTSDKDMLCRIGGDEFVIIIKGCAEELATEKMQDIFLKIRQVKKPYSMSISYGITYVSGGKYRSAEEILRSSDEKMYEFKQKNKIQAANPQ